MENKNNEMSPQELLKKLKASIAAEEQYAGTSQTDAEQSDERLLQNDEDEPALSIEQPEQNTTRYHYTVTRPAGSVVSEPEQPSPEQQIERADEPVFSLTTNTELSFQAESGRDMQDVMGAVLSDEEIAQMEQFGAMPDMQRIADEAREEAQQAFESAEREGSFDETDGNDERSLTDEVEAVYGDEAAYYDTIDAESDEEEEEDDESFLFLSSEEDDEIEQTAYEPAYTPEESAEYIQPNETSKRNVFNFIASLTKRAAKNAVAGAEAGTAAADAMSAAAGVAMSIETPDAQTAETTTTMSAKTEFMQTAEDANENRVTAGEPEAKMSVSEESLEEPSAQSEESAEPQPTAEFDAVDVNLMLAFGMEDKLKDVIGEAATQKASQQAEEDAKTMTSTDLFKIVSEESKPEEEFTDHSQVKAIFRRYRGQYRSLLLKLAASLLLCVLLFFFENITVLGGGLPRGISAEYYPIVNVMVGLQLIIFAYALVFDQLKKGAGALLHGQLIPESGMALIAVISLLYQLLIAIFCRVNYTTYNFPVALCVFFSLLYEFMNVKREMYSFNIVASKKMKLALCGLSEEERAQERSAFRSFVEESPSSLGDEEESAETSAAEEPTAQSEQAHGEELLGDTMYKLKRGAFVDGFFHKMRQYPSYKSILRFIVPIMAILSLLFCIIGFARTASLASGVSLGYFTLAMCAPISMFITYSYPLYKASKQAFANESAIIGEKVVEETLDTSVLTFEDKDIFPTKGVKVKSIKVYGSHRIDRVVFNAANIFRKYGGPLSQVFNMATLELGTTDEVYFGTIEDDGIEAMVAGSHIYIGKTDYLMRKGYAPGFDDEDEVIEGNGGICIMFMAIEDEIAAKFYVEYTIDREFEDILRHLYTAGVCISIRTFDPNIDDRMLNLLLRYDQYPVKVIKHRSDQEVNLAKEHLDSGIVSKRSVKDMLRAFMSCDRVHRAIKMGVFVKMASIGVGCVVSLLLLIFNGGGAVASVYTGLYQLFWIAALAIITKIIV
ncbi:MAG: hypothetical protein HFE78_06640 [Clostridiales bacterium]|nr:hypothetical protein [Clostridiales bacterium]